MTIAYLEKGFIDLKDAGIQTIREACNGEEAQAMAKFLPDILMDIYAWAKWHRNNTTNTCQYPCQVILLLTKEMIP